MSILVTSVINESQTIDSVALPAYKTQERASASTEVVAAATAKRVYYVEKKGDTVPRKTEYQYTQATGTTVALPDDAEVVKFTHAADIAALTVNPPANPKDGQFLTLSFVQAVTTLTMTALNSQTIVGALAAAADGGFATWTYNKSANTWYRVA